MTWSNLIQNAGTLIPTPTATATIKRYRLSDGREYSMRDLLHDPRNVECLAQSTLHHKLASGERDIERIFRRSPGGGERKPRPASNRNFANKGMHL